MPRITLVAAALSALFLVACGQSGDGAHKGGPGAGGGMPPAMVSVITVETKDLPVELEYTGQITGFREVEVRARVPGILLSRNFDEGSRITKGQSLFNIDPASFEAAKARAEAALAASEARAQQTRRTVERLKPLREAGMVSRSAFDDALAAEAVSAADLKAAHAQVAEANLSLGYTKVVAPVSGIAGRALRPEGTLVSGPDVLLTSITQVDPVYVTFGIPDNEQLRLRNERQAGRLVLPAQERFDVEVKLGDGSTYGRHGKLGFSDVRINPATGTSEARAQFPNPDGVLRPGQFVRVRLLGAKRPDAVKVPQRAVLEGPQGKFVYVVNDKSAAEPRPVKAGEWAGTDWVISEGLKAGDKVIVDGVMRIGPGAPVQVGDPAAAQGQAPGGAPGQPPAEKGAPKGDAAPATDAKK